MPQIRLPSWTITWKDNTKTEGTTFELPHGSGKPRMKRLHIFAEYMKYFQSIIEFKLSPRGWCYMLEGFKLISKGDFDKIGGAINECRKKGLIPLDFVASEGAREFEGIEIPTVGSLEDFVKNFLISASECYNYFTPNWWKSEEYYIQLLVEKVDLVTLFKPVCDDYHIPIANARGWSSIYQKWDILQRFKAAEEQGLKCVLLYCGDFDPYGLAISKYMMKQFTDLYSATHYDPRKIKIDRFGLNYEYIVDNNLTWIDNLESGFGNDMSTQSSPIVQGYISKYGVRKCEANALVVHPKEARKLCRAAIINYLHDGAKARFIEKKRVSDEKIIQTMKDKNVYDPLMQMVKNFGQTSN